MMSEFAGEIIAAYMNQADDMTIEKIVIGNDVLRRIDRAVTVIVCDD